MINRFALSCLCTELDRDKIFGVMLVYILLLLILAPWIWGGQFYAMAPVLDRLHLSYEYACMWTIEWSELSCISD